MKRTEIKNPAEDSTLVYEKLLNGVTIFEFEKTDGEVRLAIGTLNQDLIPIDKKVLEKKNQTLEAAYHILNMDPGTEKVEAIETLTKELNGHFAPVEPKERKSNPEIQTYFDLQSKAWRSFNKSKLVAIYEF